MGQVIETKHYFYRKAISSGRLQVTHAAHSNDSEFPQHLNLYTQLSADLTTERNDRWEHERKVNKESDHRKTENKERMNDQESDERNPVGSALHAFSCQSISLFLPMDDGGLCSCCETPRWPVLLHPHPSIPSEPLNFSIFLPNVTVLSDERDDSQIPAVYHHASPTNARSRDSWAEDHGKDLWVRRLY